jgi:hypothetical protein
VQEPPMRMTSRLGFSMAICACMVAAQDDVSAANEQSKNNHIGLSDSQPEDFPVPTGGAQPLGGVQSAPNARQAADRNASSQAAQRKGEFIFAPLPISSQAIGIGVAPVAAYVFYPSQSDRVSQPSTLALAGIYTSTKTYGLGLGGTFNLKNDEYRLTFLVGGAKARYEFFGIGESAGKTGTSVWLSQRGHAVLLQGLRRIKWNIFGGLRFSQRQIKATSETTLGDVFANLSPLPPIKDELNLAITSTALGVRLQRDTRNDMFYPTSGSRIDGRADFFGTYLGSTFTFQFYQFEANKYLRMGKRQTVALRGMGCGVTGNRIPFFELCQFGMLGDLRGYQAGRFRDRTMFAMQAEWRVVLWKRLGAAAFGGAGEVAPRWSAYSLHDLLPSGGSGLRFNLSKQRRINLRLDLAYSKTGGSWSMGVGEAF